MYTYGIDWDGPITEHDDDIVTLPVTECQLLQRDMEELLASISPLADSETHGVDIIASVDAI